jgi:hypothetical protein
MKAKEIATTIKEKPYRDGEALIKNYTIDILKSINFRNIHPSQENNNEWVDVGQAPNKVKYTSEYLVDMLEHNGDENQHLFYCENRIDEAMMSCGNQCDTCKEYSIKDNKIELLEEDIFCIHKYLDTLLLPRVDDSNNSYSIVGRIKILQKILQEEIDRCHEKNN